LPERINDHTLRQVPVGALAGQEFDPRRVKAGAWFGPGEGESQFAAGDFILSHTSRHGFVIIDHLKRAEAEIT
jgi:hypothetical protein